MKKFWLVLCLLCTSCTVNVCYGIKDFNAPGGQTVSCKTVWQDANPKPVINIIRWSNVAKK
jgi:hypothetical protein